MDNIMEYLESIIELLKDYSINNDVVDSLILDKIYALKLMLSVLKECDYSE